MIEGIDVSHHQGSIDWAAVADAGIGFAFLKATEGRSFIDKRYRENRDAARSLGIKVGAYHFARPSGDPFGAVDHFHSIIGDEWDLPPMLDLEVTDGVAPHALGQWVLKFLVDANSVFGDVGVYTSPGWWNSAVALPGVLHDFSLWVAHWGTTNPSTPNDWVNWQVHQYTSHGSVPGIYGRVDRNRAKEDFIYPEEKPVADDKPQIKVNSRVTAAFGTPSGDGYTIVTEAGEVVTFGDAKYLGRTLPAPELKL